MSVDVIVISFRSGEDVRPLPKSLMAVNCPNIDYVVVDDLPPWVWRGKYLVLCGHSSFL